MRTTVYLLRHAATEANLARPPRLQGRRDTPLADAGVRQAEATRDFLAIRPIDHCCCSPLRRALQTAAIVAAPHGLTPQPLDALAECNVGRWDGLDWPTIRQRDPEEYQRFLDNSDGGTYPGGESVAEVQERVAAALEEILDQHSGQSVLVVGHRVVVCTYLASLMGLSLSQALQVSLDNCGISVVVHQDGKTTVGTVNAAFHLQGVAAA
jgi:broad specificity phosphatase PhoE